jgi:Leucine-rich repeat (LRR) protein
MKKSILISLCIGSFASAVMAQSTTLNDSNFEQTLIDQGLDDVLDGEVITDSISSITNIDLSGNSISDLTGITSFSSLTRLDISNNDIISINLTQNRDLTYLNCSDNSLSSLSIDQLISLDTLICSENAINNLNTTQNSNLVYLNGSSNSITNMSLNSNGSIAWLNLEDNQLNSIYLNGNTNLIELHIGQNPMGELNTSNNSNLEILDVENGSIWSLDLSQNVALKSLNLVNNGIYELDLSNNVLLESVDCSNNNLIGLDLSNGSGSSILTMDATGNEDLTCIQVDTDILAAIPVGWKKEGVATYGELCIITSINTPEYLSIAIYPNPASSVLNISHIDELTSASVFDAHGTLVSNFDTDQISLAGFTPGFYSLIVNTTSATEHFSFIKE